MPPGGGACGLGRWCATAAFVLCHAPQELCAADPCHAPAFVLCPPGEGAAGLDCCCAAAAVVLRTSVTRPLLCCAQSAQSSSTASSRRRLRCHVSVATIPGPAAGAPPSAEQLDSVVEAQAAGGRLRIRARATPLPAETAAALEAAAPLIDALQRVTAAAPLDAELQDGVAALLSLIHI